MKRLTALFMVLAMLLSGCTTSPEEKKPVISSETISMYVTTMTYEEKLTLHFKDGQKDIPYISMDNAHELLMNIQGLLGDDGYQLTMEKEDKTVAFKRENGSMAVVDFAEGTIAWDDYNLFITTSYSDQPLDLLSYQGVNTEGEPELFYRDPSSFVRRGESMGLNFADFFIDLMYEDGTGYMPLQTFSDLFLAYTQVNLGYNGEAVFVIPGNALGDMREAYYSVGPRERSEELAFFNYVEMCLCLQFNYGLKEKHNIPSFGSLFERTGIEGALKSPDALEADKALCDVLYVYLDDLHSKFQGASPYAGDVEVESNLTPFSRTRFMEHIDTLTAEALKAYPDGRPGYEELGNTAYVTFDSFASNPENDYYSDPGTEALTDDVIGLIMYAHKQINRANSPIENVVLDLSLNTGGEANVAIYTIAWFLGECDIHVEDAMTGALASHKYKVDVNGDRVFDEKDSITHLNRYCLVSPVSFSCGNLVPASLKASNDVTLLGRQTAGGACAVQPLVAADGSLWRISSRLRLSTLFNGVFYDVDQGVAPDIVFDKNSSYYDRAALTDYINSLR